MGHRAGLLVAVTIALAASVGAAQPVAAASFSDSSFRIFQLEPNNPFVGGFADPAGVAVGPKGDVLYVADRLQGRVVEMTTYGAYVRSFGCCGSAAGKLKQPIGIATDQHGNVYVADQGNGRIDKYSAKGAFLKRFSVPSVFGVAVTAAGDIYALTRFFNTVVELSPSGQQIGGFTACPASSSPDGVSTLTCGARAIAVDAAGRILIVLNQQLHYTEVCPKGSYWNTTTPPVSGFNIVQRYAASGALMGSWGLPELPQSCFQGFAPEDNATGVAVDPNGGSHYATRLEPRIQFIDGNLAFQSEGDLGRPPFPKLTSVITGQFRALAFDCASNLYVASYFGEAVIRYTNKFETSFPCGRKQALIGAPARIGGIARVRHGVVAQVGCGVRCRGTLKVLSGGKLLALRKLSLSAGSTRSFSLKTRFTPHVGARLLATFHPHGLGTARLRTRLFAFSGIGLSVPRSAQVGRAFKVGGKVKPGRPGRLVHITASGPNGALETALVHTGAGGIYSAKLRLPTGGSWRVFAMVEPGRRAQPATSASRALVMQPVPQGLRKGSPPSSIQLACPSELLHGQTLSVHGQTLPLTGVNLTISSPGGVVSSRLLAADVGGAFAISVAANAAGSWQVHASDLSGAAADCSVAVRIKVTLTLSCPSSPVPLHSGTGTATLSGTTVPPLPGQRVTVQATGGGGARSAQAGVGQNGSFSAHIPVSSADLGQPVSATASYAGDAQHKPAASAGCSFPVG